MMVVFNGFIQCVLYHQAPGEEILCGLFDKRCDLNNFDAYIQNACLHATLNQELASVAKKPIGHGQQPELKLWSLPIRQCWCHASD